MIHDLSFPIADLHAHEGRVLLEDGSKQEDLWGINLYIRPSQGNRSRNIENEDVREKIRKIVATLVQE